MVKNQTKCQESLFSIQISERSSACWQCRSLGVKALALLSAVSAQGRAAPADDQLQEIIVTAQKRSEKLQDVPISISVLEGQNLDQSTLNVADELRMVP